MLACRSLLFIAVEIKTALFKNNTRRKKILPIDINFKITLTLTSVCVVKYFGEQTGLKNPVHT